MYINPNELKPGGVVYVDDVERAELMETITTLRNVPGGRIATPTPTFTVKQLWRIYDDVASTKKYATTKRFLEYLKKVSVYL